MSDKQAESLARLAPRPATSTLKNQFFAVMPAIEAALARGVFWKDILADLDRNGLAISPTVASNYAAQYRRRHRPAGEPGRPGRPPKSAPGVVAPVQSRPVPVLVVQNPQSATRRVANLRRPPELA